MGGGNSKAGKQEVNQVYSTIKETTMNVMNESKVSIAQTASTVQSISVSNVDFMCSGVNIGNEATVDLTAEVTIDQAMSTQLIAGIAADLDNTVDSMAGGSSGFGAGAMSMGGGNTTGGDVVNNFKSEIKDTLNTTLEQSNLTETVSYTHLTLPTIYSV